MGKKSRRGFISVRGLKFYRLPKSRSIRYLCYKLSYSQQRWTVHRGRTRGRTRHGLGHEIFLDFGLGQSHEIGQGPGPGHVRKPRTRTNIGHACSLTSDSHIFETELSAECICQQPTDVTDTKISAKLFQTFSLL